jgi:hypothetical protein
MEPSRRVGCMVMFVWYILVNSLFIYFTHIPHISPNLLFLIFIPLQIDGFDKQQQKYDNIDKTAMGTTATKYYGASW